MKKVNISTTEMDKFAGKWVAIFNNRIIAVGDTLNEISPLVSKNINDKTPDEKLATAFKVPYKDEGPYVL